MLLTTFLYPLPKLLAVNVFVISPEFGVCDTLIVVRVQLERQSIRPAIAGVDRQLGDIDGPATVKSAAGL